MTTQTNRSDNFNRAFVECLRFGSSCNVCGRWFLPKGRAKVCSASCSHNGTDHEQAEKYLPKVLLIGRHLAFQISKKYHQYDFESAYSDAQLATFDALLKWFSVGFPKTPPIKKDGRIDARFWNICKSRIVRKFQNHLKFRLAKKRNPENGFVEVMENDIAIDTQSKKPSKSYDLRARRIREFKCLVAGCERPIETRTMCNFHKEKSYRSIKKYNDGIFKKAK